LGEPENNILAVIGDASIMNGVSLEALNNIGGTRPKNLIVVFNDNEMSIGESVGVFSKAFRKVMNTQKYVQLKHEVESAIRKVNIGNPIADLISRVENQ
jgi:Deoxyxylulose-5-phosphate synthase